MIQGEAGFMKQLKLWMLRFGVDSSEGKKCCVSRAYAVCWVTPNFWENALTDEKKKGYINIQIFREIAICVGCQPQLFLW